MHAQQPQQTPENTATLAEQVRQTKQDILAVLFEIDHVTLQENPRIEADYAVKIGYLENEVLEARIAMRRAQRKATLARAQANNGLAVDESGIEKQLDTELEDWYHKLSAAVANYYQQVEARCSLAPMSLADSEELKRLFRQLAKRLHPDINPNQTDEEAALFALAQMAYQAGDLNTLRSLVSTLGPGTDEPDPTDELQLSALLTVLQAQLQVHEADLAAVKEAFPYCFKEKLADPQWVANKAQELQATKDEYLQIAAKSNQVFAELKNKMEGGTER